MDRYATLYYSTTNYHSLLDIRVAMNENCYHQINGSLTIHLGKNSSYLGV